MNAKHCTSRRYANTKLNATDMRRLLFLLFTCSTLSYGLAQTTGTYTISPDSTDLEPVSAIVGDSSIAAQFIIRRYNLDIEAPIYLHFSGTDSAFFHLDKIASTGFVDVVHVWYVPTTAGKHTAIFTTTCALAPDCDVKMVFNATAEEPTGLREALSEEVADSSVKNGHLIHQDGMTFVATPHGIYTLDGHCVAL